MARGWESKSVEEQQAEFGKTSASQKRAENPSDKGQETERQRLLLARSNVSNQLQQAQNPRYIELLTAELAELDRKLAALG